MEQGGVQVKTYQGLGRANIVRGWLLRLITYFANVIFLEDFQCSFGFARPRRVLVQHGANPTDVEYLCTGEHVGSAAVLVVGNWKENICSKGLKVKHLPLHPENDWKSIITKSNINF
jgi:hypothetical protein